GGATLPERLKVETVMPNRLRIDVDLGQAMLGGGQPLRGTIESEWLSGASAGGLRADVNLRLSPTATRFTGFDGFVFDDPSRELRSDDQEIFNGALGPDGTVRFERSLQVAQAPGMLQAGFTTRVFERGGAFSSLFPAADYSPVARFVGLHAPQPNRRNTLPVDQPHPVELAIVSAQGAAVAGQPLSVKLYNLDWRWCGDREQG